MLKYHLYGSSSCSFSHRVCSACSNITNPVICARANRRSMKDITDERERNCVFAVYTMSWLS